LLGRRSLATLVLLCLVIPTGAIVQSKTQTSKQPADKPQASAQPSATKKKTARKRRSSRARGQQSIHKDRVRDIQAALIREGYLAGKPDGAWDERTKKALARYQEDNGWQSKVVPDSRALIKLGLGPNHANLLNPESVQQNGASTPSASEGTPQ
jgi:peptidoglycan hydrolase-like protein with peptidoglycan-binding domain